ncbi:MAG: hypothetical protein WD249_01725 [Gaiellaceae bacterium]
MWRKVGAEADRSIGAILIAIIVAWLSWQLVGKPTAHRNERQSFALALQADTRASIAAFAVARPAEPVPQVALDDFREGRRLAGSGEYDEAIEHFERSLAALESECPDCPGLEITPG